MKMFEWFKSPSDKDDFDKIEQFHSDSNIAYNADDSIDEDIAFHELVKKDGKKIISNTENDISVKKSIDLEKDILNEELRALENEKNNLMEILNQSEIPIFESPEYSNLQKKINDLQNRMNINTKKGKDRSLQYEGGELN